MSTFSWLHKKLKAPNAKKTESFTSNKADKQDLLKQLAVVEMLSGWKNGILIYGKFGFQPLKPEGEDDDDVEKEEHCIENVEEEEEEEEEKPLMVFTTFKKDISTYIDVNLPKPDFLSLNKMEKRVTLADLFLAENDDPKVKLDSVKIVADSVEKTKKGASFAKKKICPELRQDSGAMNKVNKLMKRMLKKKIHPDLGIKFQRMDSQIKSEVSCKKAHTESVSLLPIPGGVVG